MPMLQLRRTMVIAVVTALTVTLLGGGRAAAQGTGATLRGTVRVGRSTRSNVTVNVVNLESQNERQAISEVDGTWSVAGLQPGRYEVRVDDASYRPYKSGTITLSAGQQRTEDISLQEVARTTRTPPAAPPGPPPPPAVVVPDYIPSPDRWHLEFPAWQRYPPDVPGAHPYVDRSKLGPYKQTMLKGDYPAFGTQDVFLVLTGVLEVPFEYRRLPTPSGVSQARPGSDEFFGKPEQYAFVTEAVGSLEIFKGDTSFKPRTWALRVTPVFNLNYVNIGEYNIVNATPEDRKTRRRTDVALQEAFGEYKLTDIGNNYDFISIRAGIQPFTSDFRGFLYRDSNLGVRLFGTWGRNRNQWNIAAFDQLQKETNSELNLHFERRDQKVLIANYFRQDFGVEGYTISPSVAANFDKGAGFFYDENGFLVQPSPIGLIVP